MPTVCLRGGCLTGPNHSGAELHGFLAYLARAVKEGRVNRIYGYRGSRLGTTSTPMTSSCSAGRQRLGPSARSRPATLPRTGGVPSRRCRRGAMG